MHFLYTKFFHYKSYLVKMNVFKFVSIPFLTFLSLFEFPQAFISLLFLLGLEIGL